VSLPLPWPALVYSGVLDLLSRIRAVRLPLIIGRSGQPESLLTTYLFKLTKSWATRPPIS